MMVSMINMSLIRLCYFNLVLYRIDDDSVEDDDNDGDKRNVDNSGDNENDKHLLDLAVVLLKVEFEIRGRLSGLNCLPLVHLHCL